MEVDPTSLGLSKAASVPFLLQHGDQFLSSVTAKGDHNSLRGVAGYAATCDAVKSLDTKLTRALARFQQSSGVVEVERRAGSIARG